MQSSINTYIYQPKGKEGKQQLGGKVCTYVHTRTEGKQQLWQVPFSRQGTVIIGVTAQCAIDFFNVFVFVLFIAQGTVAPICAI